MRLAISSPAAGPSDVIDIIPKKIVGVGANYRAHVDELGYAMPAEPLIFLKPSSSLVADGEPIVLPPGLGRIDHEGELAVVIGRRARNIAPERAEEAILGVACANDITAREWQSQLKAERAPWTTAKGCDGFCPLGPVLVTGLDVSDLAIETRVSGRVAQSGRTSQMVVSVPELIAYVSGWMTLEVGDVILTGTPAGVGPLAPGDTVEVEIEGIGVLANPVVGG